jgi:pimeloyl-ACP methyl ester carboxylesterase
MIRWFRNAAVAHMQAAPRKIRLRRQGGRVVESSTSLVSTAGYRIEVKLVQPACEGPHPAVLLVPGTNNGRAVFEGWSLPVNARELAAWGWLVLTFDPAGRGESWGEEDYGGVEHQDNVRVALRYLASQTSTDPSRLGVLSVSLGLSMACGALADWPECPAKWLLDWEGPSDRDVITSGGRILAPAMGHSLKDDRYWKPREARLHAPNLSCGYWRLQAQPDHAQGQDVRHSTRMMAAVESGHLPWFQLNRHQRNVHPEHPVFVEGGRLAANRMILEAMGVLGGFRGVSNKR